MDFDVVQEIGGANYFNSLMNDFHNMEEEISEAHPNFPFDILIGLRCRSVTYPRKTSQRFYKKDNMLNVSMAFVEEEVASKLKREQRYIFGHTVFDHLSSAIKKYAPPSLERDNLIEDIRLRFFERGWLTDGIDYSDLSDED